MGELEEKLNAILGDQAAMGQIMTLAQSLGKSAPAEPAREPEQEPPEPGWDRAGADFASSPPPPSAPSAPSGENPGPSPLGDLSALDPKLLQLGLRVWQAYQGDDGRSTALLQALRPYLREERRPKLDRAVQIAKLSHGIRVALQLLSEKGGESHV